MKARASRASIKAQTSSSKGLRAPASQRLSSKAVCTVTSAAASCRHCACVRTLEPMLKPTSQQAPMKASSAALTAGWASSSSASGSSSSTSMSECGNSSPRP